MRAWILASKLQLPVYQCTICCAHCCVHAALQVVAELGKVVQQLELRAGIVHGSDPGSRPYDAPQQQQQVGPKAEQPRPPAAQVAPWQAVRARARDEPVVPPPVEAVMRQLQRWCDLCDDALVAAAVDV